MKTKINKAKIIALIAVTAVFSLATARSSETALLDTINENTLKEVLDEAGCAGKSLKLVGSTNEKKLYTFAFEYPEQIKKYTALVEVGLYKGKCRHIQLSVPNLPQRSLEMINIYNRSRGGSVVAFQADNGNPSIKSRILFEPADKSWSRWIILRSSLVSRMKSFKDELSIINEDIFLKR